MAIPPTLEVHLADRRQLSPSVRELTFERTDGQAFAFEAGQWISMVLPHATGEIRRAYSIASPPEGTARFQLAVTHVQDGPGSTFLHELTLGAKLRAIGPQGFFTRPLAMAGPSIFVGTGTGVTPLRSMIRAAVAAGSQLPVWLLFGVREEHDILYRDELEGLAAQHPAVRFLPTLSRAHASWPGRRGYVQTHLAALWHEMESLGLGAPHAYVCGLQKMVGAVRDLLRKDLSVPRQQVHSERYD